MSSLSLWSLVIVLFFFSSLVSAKSDNFVPDTVWHLNDSFCLFNPTPDTTPFLLWTQQLAIYGNTPQLRDELCLPGFYCPYMQIPQNSTWPASCQPTPQCAIDRVVQGDFCDLQSKWEPVVCPPGYYCPTFDQRIQCPSGYWCGLGTVTPIACSSLSVCPAGSIDEKYVGSLIAVVIVDVCLYLLYKLSFWWQARKGRNFLAAYNAEKEKKKTEEKEKTTDSAENNHHSVVNPKLIDSFMRARGDLSEIELQFSDVSVRVRAPHSLDDEDDENMKAKENPDASEVEDENYVKILSGVSGSLEAGRLTVVMGPAGCGKTTLLSALTGANRWSEHWQQSGAISINGSKTKSLTGLSALVGAVGQEDILHKELTVRDNILYSAAVRLPASWTRAQVEEHVDMVMDALQLTQIRDTVVGDELTRGVSGGQRKRTSIAIELAAAPALVLLDEATAGLDAHVALELVDALQQLARAARLTVGMVLQQPRLEIWRSLDTVLLMAAGGRTVYLGPPRLAELYFSQRCGVMMKAFDNPANVIIDAISDKATGAMLAEKWVRSGATDIAEIAASLPIPQQLPPLPAAVTVSDADTPARHNTNMSMSIGETDVVTIHVMSPDSALEKEKDGTRVVNTSPIYVRPQSSSMNRTLAAEGALPLDGVARTEESKVDASPRQPGNGSGRGTPSVEKEKASSRPPSAGKQLDLNKLSEQLSGRSAPWYLQVWEAHKRALASQMSKSDSAVIELFVCVLIGCIMGVSGVGRYQGTLINPYSAISPSSQDRFVAEGAMYVCMTISLAASVAGVGVFGYDISIIHREADAGHSISAFYIGHASAQIYRQLLMALHFTTCYHVLFNPQIDFGTMYAIDFLLFFNFYAAAQIFSFLFSPLNATIVCSMITLMVCMFNGFITEISYGIKVLFAPWWGSEAFFSKQVERLTHIYQVDQITAPKYGYDRDYVSRDLAIMFIIGFGYQLIGLILCINVFHHRTAKLKNKIAGTIQKGWNMIMA